jgi:PAS domain S-box-containing protein
MTTTPDHKEWRTSADGCVLVVSKVWLEIVGRRATEAPGYCWLSFVHEDDRARVEAEIAAHSAARRAYVVAFRALHHAGRIVWVRSGGEPLVDGGYVGWTRVARHDQHLSGRVAAPSRVVRHGRAFVVA